jgi:GT2 family glycosyltransferase
LSEATVTVIVPIYNALHVVRPCIESIARWTDLDHHKLVLADDCSDEHTGAALASWANGRQGVEVVRNAGNLGFVRNCNRALRTVDTDYVVLLNSDTCVTPRWIDKMVACMESDRRIGVASPISNSAPHLRIPMIPGADYLQMNALIEHHSQRDYPDVTTPEGFCFMISRECLATIGYFDEVFDAGYGEESDFAMRAAYHGFRTVCVDDTYIYHRGRASFGEKQREQLSEQNGRIFFERWAAKYPTEFAEFERRNPLGYLKTSMDGYRLRSLPDAFK